MNKSLLALVFILTFGIFAIGQPPTELLERLQKIRLLESDRHEVRLALAEFTVSDEDGHEQRFSVPDLDVNVSYASGTCSEDDDDGSWKVAEWKVTRMEIEPDESFAPESLKIDLKGFKKEQKYANEPDTHILHNKKLGIAFELDEGKVEKIILFPRSGSEKQLCENAVAKKFYSLKSWFGDSKLKDRTIISCGIGASVTALDLSASKLSATTGKTVSVTTTAVDPENDPLIYIYIVSAGQIRGQGAKVEWDLTGVPPGSYTITAGVDEGAGVIGKTETRTVVVE